ncbi:AAA domain-containing protein [Ditylenchus destructor]|nr:AAA domain-containing protein [Ditylenchus destructor]
MAKGSKTRRSARGALPKEDSLRELSLQYWSPSTADKHSPFTVKTLTDIYEDLLASSFQQRKVIFLEFSQYLEAYLWKNFNLENTSDAYVLSIVIMVNEKVRERIIAWKCFESKPEHFSFFFAEVLKLALNDDLSYLEQSVLIAFLNNCLNSLEVDVVRQEVMKLCSLPIWVNLLPSQRDDLLNQNTKLKKFWSKVEKKFEKMEKTEFDTLDFNRRFLWKLLQRFKRVVDCIDDESQELDVHAVTYAERFLLFMIDLEAQLTTRRFFNALLLSSHIIAHCSLSQFITAEHGSLFCDLLSMLKFYARFEVDDVSGQPLTAAEVTKRHYNYVMNLQQAAFKFFQNSMSEFALLNVGSVDTRKFLKKQLGDLSAADLYKIAEHLHLVPPVEQKQILEENHGHFDDVDYLSEMIIFYCERRPSQLQRINNQPLYPSEKVIWDENLVPYEEYDGQNVLPLNKLNLQFLTLHDYLLRNFNLFQMESTYEIRQDLEDMMFRMKPWKHEFNPEEVVWGGWARMALSISGCRIVHVGKPLVGESCPSEVKADIQITLPKRQEIRQDWEGLRKNDVLFLLKVTPSAPVGTKFDVRQPFKSQFPITVVRGCEVEGMIGPEGKVLDEWESRDAIKKMQGDVRTFRVRFDPNQYQMDADSGSKEMDVYFTFNLLVRRDPKSNNFKAVLATIRQLLNTDFVVPDWLQDIVLGYGEPNAAHYSNSFPSEKIICDAENPAPPFKLTFKEFVAQYDVDEKDRDRSIIVECEKKLDLPILAKQEQIRQNAIEFTPAQIEAIKSGMQPGLTMVVGPPGTGKTDVAVQIISNIYHNWPQQRTLIVTHSNQALNQLFEKIMALDIDERHLLRMGHGEEALETEKDFSRYGRVNYVLKERLNLLKRVEKLRDIVGEIGDVSYSCETAGYFYRYTVARTWDHFVDNCKKARQSGQPSNSLISETFPFTRFFVDDGSQELFKRANFEEDLEAAEAYWKHIQKIFFKLEEFLAFELLRNARDRADYLLVKEAKIIAMTCTHAALRRKELVDLGFRYDNILMEESAQILEVETFIPLLLQDPHDGRYRLKRWIMIGDHHQLPPIVQNVAYQKYSNMEQSLFARFIRLGVPHVELDAQGRARSEIAALYTWRYKSLGDLPHVQRLPQFVTCNAGFLFNYQLIDVPDFNGVGETTPSPYFYQNLGEAEYAVALFAYMRILGYPAEKISIITTYNGQASLLRDIINKRCADNPLIGVPAKISTVDKYQGQQNDYIILSLVRTRFVGHLRDIRRLIVALSRARLGLYIVGRVSLFKSCYELQPAFNQLLQRPTRLVLVPNEAYGEDHHRKTGGKPSMNPMEIVDTPHMNHFVAEFYKSNLALLQKRYAEENGVVTEISMEVEEPKEDVKAVEEPEGNTEEQKNEGETTDTTPSGAPKEKAEGAIVFEQIDFERLQEMPKY